MEQENFLSKEELTGGRRYLLAVPQKIDDNRTITVIVEAKIVELSPSGKYAHMSMQSGDEWVPLDYINAIEALD